MVSSLTGGSILADTSYWRRTRYAGGVGMVDAEKIAKFGEKKLAVGAFRGAGFGPAGNERVGDLNRHARILRSEGQGAKRKGIGAKGQARHTACAGGPSWWSYNVHCCHR